MKTLTRQVPKDPVCGMRVSAAEDAPTLVYEGSSFWFCSKDCREAFRKSPSRFTKGKSWIVRLLERIADVNEKEFGGKPPRCCGGHGNKRTS